MNSNCVWSEFGMLLRAVSDNFAPYTPRNALSRLAIRECFTFPRPRLKRICRGHQTATLGRTSVSCAGGTPGFLNLRSGPWAVNLLFRMASPVHPLQVCKLPECPVASDDHASPSTFSPGGPHLGPADTPHRDPPGPPPPWSQMARSTPLNGGHSPHVATVEVSHASGPQVRCCPASHAWGGLRERDGPT